MEQKSEHMAVPPRQRRGLNWVESWRVGKCRMTEGGKPGGTRRTSALGMVRRWTLVFSEEQGKMNSSHRMSCSGLKLISSSFSSTSCPWWRRVWQWPGKTGWMLEIGVRMIESTNVASGLLFLLKLDFISSLGFWQSKYQQRTKTASFSAWGTQPILKVMKEQIGLVRVSSEFLAKSL